MSIKEFRSLFLTLDEKIPEAEETNWQIELEYGRETFIPTGEEVQFLENNKTGEKCVIIQITRDI
ncbi:MAG: hypothetical protein CM15mP58_13610 [Burkholderiaceae bacterium]|nr:MAG: hypothetical protein CM15mP58_13610 [Burkholderiaceae bacterium]